MLALAALPRWLRETLLLGGMLGALLALQACEAGPWMPPESEITRTLPLLVERYDGSLPGVEAWAQRVGETCEVHVPDGPRRTCFILAEYAECVGNVDPNAARPRGPAAELNRWNRRCGERDWTPELRRILE